MASLGHFAIGMVAARVYRRRVERGSLAASMAWWSAVSMFPDADVIGFAFGVRYADPWGHRGATHSFAFSIGVAIVFAVLAPLVRAKPWRTFGVASVVLASHAVLDTLTDGGLGCALLWPFDDQRYFAPWNPIPVAPIGKRFFSGAGLHVALTELMLFAPLFAYALWPRGRADGASGSLAADEAPALGDTDA